MERLKDLRTEKGLTTSALGKIVGCSNPTITHYERGDREPSLEMLCKLADFFGVSVDYLIGHEKKSVMERPTSELVENFIREYSELFSERRFIEMAKLYKAVDEEVREAMLIYLVAFMNRQGINTETILGY
jgi:transcriptional regulator, XRE family|nr:MAG TPA: helix-turn-helix domain protein [Caudoviricetes sp.]